MSFYEIPTQFLNILFKKYINVFYRSQEKARAEMITLVVLIAESYITTS